MRNCFPACAAHCRMSALAVVAPRWAPAVAARQGRRDVSRRSSGDGVDGVPRKEDKAVVHFWHLFGSIPECRRALTASPKTSAYRNAPLLESRVRALARVFDTETSGLDVPRVLTKQHQLLLWEANEVVRRVVELKRIAPELGGRALTAAPGLLLCNPEDVAAARQEMEFARGTKKARETIAAAPDELLKAVEMLAADEVGAEAWRG